MIAFLHHSQWVGYYLHTRLDIQTNAHLSYPLIDTRFIRILIKSKQFKCLIKYNVPRTKSMLLAIDRPL